jgi:FtsZ-binding cell division protein ZapB
VIVTTEGTVLTPRAAPRTAQELAAMREQRKWLSDQLQSAQSRRRDVARALEQARDPVNQNGLQARLQVLDRRIVQIENEIGTTGQLMATAPAAAVSVADVPRPGDRPFDRGPSASVVLIVFIVGVLLPMAVALGRILTRRFAHAAPDPAAREAAARLARLEQAVDAIAVEVERVSEGQRFVTRLLADARGQTEAAPALRGADTYRPQ